VQRLLFTCKKSVKKTGEYLAQKLNSNWGVALLPGQALFLGQVRANKKLCAKNQK
jgi:hypothetical protein